MSERFFRRRFFGGFDTGDVISYIEELAAQRNKYKTTGDKLETELIKLSAEIKRLQAEVDDADMRIMDIKAHALEQASDSVTVLNASYSSIRSEMETTATTICRELNKLGGTLQALSSVLDRTSSRFNELQVMAEREKAEAIAARTARFSH
jgi:chromosome segregation ATPase